MSVSVDWLAISQWKVSFPSLLVASILGLLAASIFGGLGGREGVVRADREKDGGRGGDGEGGG